MDSTAYRRYSRQMLLNSLGAAGQLGLSAASILVVGAGGLGATALSYLAGAGVKSIRIVDNDVVDESNLHRQILFGVDCLGLFKCDAAANRIRNINPNVHVEAVRAKFTYLNALELLGDINIVVDCTDNIESRYCISDACVVANLPFVFGSAIGWEGQVTVLCGGHGEKPCYRCLYPNWSRIEGCRSCASAGVVGPVPGAIGCFQAMETIKYILCHLTRGNAEAVTNIQLLVGRQLFYDGLTGETEVYDIHHLKRRSCVVCGDESSRSASVEERLRECYALSQSQLQEQSQWLQTMRCDHLPQEWSVHVQDYWQQYLEPCLADNSVGNHILLDVRPKAQFNLLSLLQYFPSHEGSLTLSPSLRAAFKGSTVVPSTSELCTHTVASSTDKNTMKIVNFPYEMWSVVRHGQYHREGTCWKVDDAAMSAQTQNSLLRTLSTVESLLSQRTPILVLCRRGNDSKSATDALQRVMHMLGMEDIVVRNIQGGLDAWREHIDPMFPVY